MASGDLAHHFEAYSKWRRGLLDTICDYRSWLNVQELNDAQIDLRIQHLLDTSARRQAQCGFCCRVFARQVGADQCHLFRRLRPTPAAFQCRTHYHVPTELLYDESKPTSKFFETLAGRVIQIYEVANRDVENWLKAVIAPMESQVREHQLQLRRRMESIKRIYKATDTLEDRIAELEHMQKAIHDQISEIKVIRQHIGNALAFEQPDEDQQAA